MNEMTKTAHTPGPWRYQRETHSAIGRPTRTTYEVYTAGGEYGHPATCGREDDARLVAAAPSLLALVEQAYELSQYAAASKLDNTPEFLDGLMELLEKFQPAARAVLAEARGESPSC